MSRKATISRKTKETDIEVSINLDGTGESTIETPIGFLDHMLDAFARHSRFDLTVKATGDTHIDGHHTVEDVGICLGQALKEALGDAKGIERYGHSTIPMDEALVHSTVDLCNRTAFIWKVEINAPFIGDFDTELTAEFFQAVAANNPMNLHMRLEYGRNAHHIVESLFKAFARSMRQAVEITGDTILSTKGSL